MTFVPRHPVLQESQLQHDPSKGTLAQGCVLYLSGDGLVACVTESGHEPMGFAMQNIVAENASTPKGHQYPGELGSSDALIGDPLAVAMGGGTFETTAYVDVSGPITAGEALYAAVAASADNGKLTNSTSSVALSGGSPKKCATALVSLTADEVAANKPLLVKLEL